MLFRSSQKELEKALNDPTMQGEVEVPKHSTR